MKKLAISILATLIAAQSYAGYGKFEHKQDRFEESDEYKWIGLDMIPSGYSKPISFAKIFYMRHNNDGKARITDYNIYLSYRNTLGSLDYNSYHNCGDVKWLLDGKLFKGGESNNKDEVNSNVFFLFLSKNEFAQFANASTIEYRICGKDGKFDKYEMEGIKQVYSEYIKNHP